MFACRPTTDRRSGLLQKILLLIAIAAMMLDAAPAYAQSGSDPNRLLVLFGDRPAPSVRPITPPTYIVPMVATPPLTITITPRPSSTGSTVIVAYCVRLCDGRYFPLPLSSGSPHATPITLCRALCPASKTRIYLGIDIDGAFATNGSRYSGLATAFRYRKELITGCTCNGKDVLGTATIVVAEDPTLRAGDIIATRQGLQVFTGAARVTHRAKDFRPIEKYPRLSASLRTKVKW